MPPSWRSGSNLKRRRPDGATREPGECWFRSGATCPFSRQRTEELGQAVPEELRDELAHIHELCGQKITHRPYPGIGRLYDIG